MKRPILNARSSILSQLNSYETDFLFNEIFERETYLRHGIEVCEGGTVFDVGANIGLFTLFVKTRFPSAKVHAFEPIPEASGCLAKNTAQFGTDVKIHNVALSDRHGHAPFIYYSGYSVLSGFHTNTTEDALVIKRGLRNLEYDERMKQESLIDDRFRSHRSFSCPMKTVSEVLQEEKIGAIDLLKIDTEKSELSVLLGIDNDDWQKVRQVVLEAHGQREAGHIHELLQQRGFQTIVERDDELSASEIYNLYARRP